MLLKILLLILFFGVMVGVGLYCRRHATDVSGFVLGGRSVGPWLTAFAYGTSYFSAVIFVGCYRHTSSLRTDQQQGYIPSHSLQEWFPLNQQYPLF